MLLTVFEPSKSPFGNLFRQYDNARWVFLFIRCLQLVHLILVQQILFMQYYCNVAWAYYKLRY